MVIVASFYCGLLLMALLFVHCLTLFGMLLADSWNNNSVNAFIGGALVVIYKVALMWR